MISCLTMLPFRAMRALSFLLLSCAMLLSSSFAEAESNDLQRLIYNLANNEDFRVRTQAALALGASKSDRAVQPLCSALGDQNTTVRAASAAALGRLALRAGQPCLEKRLGGETSDVVKATIQKALELIKGGAGNAEPAFASDTKFYVSIGKTNDKTGRNGSEVDGIVRTAMTSKIGQTTGLVAAPPNETPAEAKRRLAAHAAVKGFFLSPGVSPPDYSNGNLKMKIEVAMLSYPEKNLIGSFSVNLTEPGVSPGSTDSENELIAMAAERAIEKFMLIASNQ